MMERKKVLLFGANKLAEDLLASDVCEVAYILDNDESRHGKRGFVCGDESKEIEVFPVSKCLEEKPGSFVILLMMQSGRSREEAENQLNGMGLVKNRDYGLPERDLTDIGYFMWDCRYKRSVLEKENGVYPKILHLGLSDVCNLQCLFCGFHGMKTMWSDCGHFMTMETTKVIAEQTREIDTIDTLYITHDGEDFLNKQWFEIVQYILQHTGIDTFWAYTNGMLLNDENIEKLQKLDCGKIKLVISIDGNTAQENDEQRKGSSYRIIRDNVRNAASKLDRGRFTIMINNNHVIAEETIAAQDYVFTEYHQEAPDYLKEDFADYDIPILAGPTLFLQPIEAGFPQTQKYKPVKVRKTKSLAGCLNPFEIVSVNAQGDVLLCGCNVAQDIIGNVHDNTILKMWLGNEKLNEVRRMIKEEKKTPDVCRSCSRKIDGDFYLVCEKDKKER